MKHKDMNYDQRDKLRTSLSKEGIKNEVFTEEPFIQLKDGTIIYIDEVD